MNENENNEQIENIVLIEENKEKEVIDNNNADVEEINIVANNIMKMEIKLLNKMNIKQMMN